MDMLIGRTAGTIGETSAIAILIGAIFLILMGVINLRIPASYIITFAVFMLLFGGHGFDGSFKSTLPCWRETRLQQASNKYGTKMS